MGIACARSWRWAVAGGGTSRTAEVSAAASRSMLRPRGGHEAKVSFAELCFDLV
jgi:hypothetical protein